MLEAFREFIARQNLIEPGDRVLVGFSGGADSTCLLHLLVSAGMDVVAGTLHHGQRPEADLELEKAAAFCERLGIPFVSGRADVPSMSADLGIGLEEAGRIARYAFFEESAKETGCTKIATAHTQSDLAETVLLNLSRGSGMAGLAGIPVRRDSVIRPLLFARREETAAYCRLHGLQTFEDPANTDLRFARSRIRANVIPELLIINPAFERAAARLAATSEEEDRFLDGAAAAALERAEMPLNGDLRFLTLDAEARFDRNLLRHFPPVLLKRAIRLLAEAFGAKLDFDLTQKISASIMGVEGGSMTAEGGEAVFQWDEMSLHVSRLEPESGFRNPLLVPGEVRDEELGWRLASRVEEALSATPKRDAMQVQIDIDGFRGPLHFRSFEPGDSMLPIGGVGRRKLADLLSEAKLTLLARKRLPIICDIIGPIWAPGVALDERVRVSPGSERALTMVFAPLTANSGDGRNGANPRNVR